MSIMRYMSHLKQYVNMTAMTNPCANGLVKVRGDDNRIEA